MPVFATGHAQFPFDQAVAAMATAISHSGAPIDEVLIVVSDLALAKEALRLVRLRIPGARMA